MVDMIAIEPHDGRTPGQPFEASERQAAQLESRNLAKRIAPEHRAQIAPAHQTQAVAGPLDSADGEDSKSPSSRAARVSRPRTARASKDGALRSPIADD